MSESTEGEGKGLDDGFRNKAWSLGGLWPLLKEDEVTLLVRVRVLTEDDGLEATEDGAESERIDWDLSLMGADESKDGMWSEALFKDVSAEDSVSHPITMLTGAVLVICP